MSEDPINQQVQDQKRKRISLNLSLEDEINAAPVTDTLMMPQQTATEVPVQQQVTTPKLYYEEMAERIEKKQYNRKVFIKWKRSQSSQMQAVTGSLKRLTSLLDASVDQGDFETIKNEYLTLVQACDTYLDNHAPSTDEGMARYAMVEQIKSHVLAEMRTIDGKSRDITQEDRSEGKKWRDVLIGVPVVAVSRDKIRLSDEQGQTSSVKRLEVNGQRYIYKKADRVSLKGDAGLDSPRFMGAFTETCQELMNELIGMEDRNNPMYKDMPEAARTARIAELKENHYASKKAH